MGLLGCVVQSAASAATRSPVRSVDLARRERAQGDALVDRAHRHAQVAADAFLVLDLEVALAVAARRDRLVRGVFAGDVAAAALDALALVDHRLADRSSGSGTASR